MSCLKKERINTFHREREKMWTGNGSKKAARMNDVSETPWKTGKAYASVYGKGNKDILQVELEP